MTVVRKKKLNGRTAPRVTGPFDKIKALDCFDLVRARICDGWPLSELARWIQEEKHELADVSRAALVQLLTSYRKTIPAADLVAKRIPSAILRAEEKLDGGVDELLELEELYRIQLKRIKIDHATEENIGKLLPSMTGEIKEARQILESMANLKMDLGIRNRVSKKHEVSVEVDEEFVQDLSKNFANPSVKKVLENPESRYRVMGTVEQFLKLHAKEKEVKEHDEDAER